MTQRTFRDTTGIKEEVKTKVRKLPRAQNIMKGRVKKNRRKKVVRRKNLKTTVDETGSPEVIRVDRHKQMVSHDGSTFEGLTGTLTKPERAVNCRGSDSDKPEDVHPSTNSSTSGNFWT